MKRPIDWREDRSAVREKVAESAHCVLPIVLIVVLLCLTAAPMKPDLLLSFLIGGVMLVVGMGLFSLGAEQSMTPIGTKIGTALTRTKNLPLILGVSFALGFAITVAEPDLQVLAETVPHISSTVLLLTVGVGVGLFMAVCMLRIVTGANLRWLLIGCYALIFLLAAFSDPDFLGIAFDSGGVTTGPMTVPFILAMGLGVSNIRSDRRAEADSFGLVALCSVGPILAVLILGFFYQGSDAVADLSSASFGSSTAIGGAFLASVPLYLREMAISMLPIVAIFFLFQVTLLRLPGRSLAKILIGILYTYVGLVLFLTGVNVGFSPLGAELGAELAARSARHGARLVHHLGRACRRRAGKADRERQRWRDPRQGHPAQPLCRHRAGHGPIHAARADGNLHSVVPRARLRHRAGAVVLRAGHLYGHRLRLRRRGLRPNDGNIHAPVRHGRKQRARRQHPARRLRRGGPCRHDAAAVHSGRRLRL